MAKFVSQNKYHGLSKGEIIRRLNNQGISILRVGEPGARVWRLSNGRSFSSLEQAAFWLLHGDPQPSAVIEEEGDAEGIEVEA